MVFLLFTVPNKLIEAAPLAGVEVACGQGATLDIRVDWKSLGIAGGTL